MSDRGLASHPDSAPAASAPGTTLPTLAQSLAAWSGHLDGVDIGVGELGPGWFAADALMTDASPEREALLKIEADRCTGLDIKGQCAFLIGDTAYYLAMALAVLYLTERQVPDLAPENLALGAREVTFTENGETLRYHQLRLRFLSPRFLTDRPDALPCGGVQVLGDEALRGCLRRQLEQFYAPLIKRLHATARLSRGAQWRLVADALAQAFLTVGRALGCEDTAREEALAIIRAPNSPLFNRQTDFVDISVPSPGVGSAGITIQAFRARGGCCRYYTSDTGDLCATCVLHKPQDRDRLLAQHLAAQV